MTALIDRRCAAAEDAWRRCHPSLSALLHKSSDGAVGGTTCNINGDDKRLHEQQWRAWLVKQVPMDASDLFPSVRTIIDADLSDPK
jgi:hypothetical protein